MARDDNGNTWEGNDIFVQLTHESTLEERAAFEFRERTRHLYRGYFSVDKNELSWWFKSREKNPNPAMDIILGRNNS